MTLRNQQRARKNQELALESQELSRKAQELSAETRQAQLFMNLNNQWGTGGIRKVWNEIKQWEWEDYEDYLIKYGDPESFEKQITVASYWEAFGVYVKEGLVSIRLVALFNTMAVKGFFDKFLPIFKEERVRENSPRICSEGEYLYIKLMEYIQEHPELAT